MKKLIFVIFTSFGLPSIGLGMTTPKLKSLKLHQYGLADILVDLENAKDFESAVAKKLKNLIVLKVLICGPHGRF